MLYLVGTFLVTIMVFNVPRNNALEAVPPGDPGSAELWASYLVNIANAGRCFYRPDYLVDLIERSGWRVVSVAAAQAPLIGDSFVLRPV